MYNRYGELPCDMGQLVELLHIDVRKNTGKQLYCRCPFCDDRKAHLNIRLDGNVFRCNRCGKGGGILHLYAAVNDVNLSTAYEELCRIFNTGSSITHQAVTATLKTQEPDIASAEIRSNTYENLLSMLTLCSSHRESLLKRGLTEEAIQSFGYRTTPAMRSGKLVTELLDRGCVLEGVPGFYRDQSTGKWELDVRKSGIMLPDRNLYGQIEAIQIRLDDTSKGKFRNLTSVDRYMGTQAVCCPHYVGVSPCSGSVCLTEGIMKADIAFSLAGRFDYPYGFVGLTGVGSKTQYLRVLKELPEFGIDRILLMLDADHQTNQAVSDARQWMLTEGQVAGYDMIPISWDPKDKGIDDLLLAFCEQRGH